jgi:uncharacterized membrane protein
MQRLSRIAWVPLFLVVVSCQGSGDLPLDQVDPDAVAAHPSFDQVNAIMNRSCVPCHQGETDDEGGARALGASAEPNLEACSQIVAQRNSIWEQVDGNLMPPGAWPRLTSQEKLIIQRWIDDGAPAPCN